MKRIWLREIALIAVIIRKNRILIGLYIGIFITCFSHVKQIGAICEDSEIRNSEIGMGKFVE